MCVFSGRFHHNALFMNRSKNNSYGGYFVSHLTKIALLALTSLLLTACFGKHALVREESFAIIEQCISEQQKQQQQMLALQQQFAETFDALADKLAKPLQIEAPTVYLHNKQPSCSTPSTTTESEAMTHSNKQLVGEIENAWFPELDLQLIARIDTGATTASLDARNIQIFERDGEQWVQFSIAHPTSKELIKFERKRVRKVRINQSNTDVPESRPVVELQVLIGNISQLAEFTLSDRSHLGYQALIGRNVLRDVMLVDVSKAHIAPPAKNLKP